MGFVMSPMSTAAMNAVDPSKAGAASGTLSMSRMVGGTFGVAALGALVTGLGRSRLDQLLPGATPGQRAHLADNIGSGATAHGLAPDVVHAMKESFIYAMSHGLRLGAGVALLGAAIASVLIADRAQHPHEAAEHRGPEAQPEPARA
jgi:hypothetical protein